MISTAEGADDPRSVDEVIRERRTINFFRPDPPPRELVLEAIDAARWAPNHHLTEPWRFYLLSEHAKSTIVELNAERVAREQGEAAARSKRERWSAIPGWLVVTCVRSGDELRAREDYAATCCAVYAFCLSLWSRGVGTKWTTGEVTRDVGFYDAIWADPEVERVTGMVWYGYAAEVPVSVRRPVSEVLVEI